MHIKTIFLAAGLWITMPVAVFSQGVDQATIAQLQAQIQALQNQIRQVQQQSVSPTLQQKPVVGSVRESREEAPQNIPSFTRDLFFGVKKSSEVSDLQEFLTDQGYYAGPVSGNFGLLTLSSVKKFQQAHGIKPTGYFGSRSRAIANEILQKLVGQVCPREEGCEGNILPVEKIRIVAESDLEGVVGEYFAVGFRASGGSGNYEMDGESRIPGDFKFGVSACEAGTVCLRDKITLSGVSTRSGVFDIVIFTRDTAPSTDIGIAYGKERFTVVIKDKIISGKPPVISGIKGPTTLRVGEEGIWVINAYDPQNGNLSYRVVWGDESLISKDAMTPSAPQATAFRQTATFSHIYNVSGIYTLIFSVVNEKGLEAKTSVSVNVGSVDITPPPVPVTTGHLNIDPPYATLKVGDSVRVKAIFTPPRPACLDAIPSCKAPEQAPYEVEVAFVSDNPKIAAIETGISTCASPPPGIQPTCPLAFNSVRGVSAGDTVITATERGNMTARMKVVVSVNYDACRLDKLDGSNITKRAIEDQKQCLADMCDVYGPANLVNGAASKCVFQGQEIKRYISTVSPTITIQVPNGGEQYQKGSPITFGWSQNYTAKSLEVRLFDSVTGREYYRASVSGSIGKNAGVLSGETTNVVPSKYKILICDLTRPDNYMGQEPVCDSSDAPFSIIE